MTVIDARVHRSSARNALVAFIVATVIVGLLAATVAADRMHPILAAFCGGFIGVITGAVVWLVVRIWPVLRLIWWWLPEILLGFVAVYGWMFLTSITNLPVRLVVVAVLVGVPAGVPVIRRKLIAFTWCVIVRHRLRVCFAQFIRANVSGSLPLILLARPTPVGERVWVYLRPGLSFAEVNARLDKIAVACHASTVLVERASQRTAALLRIDVKRREVLAASVSSPLVDLVDPTTPAPTAARAVIDAPTALDLPQVTEQNTPPATPAGTTAPASAAAPRNGATRKPAPVPTVPLVTGSDGEDLTDWID